MSEQRVFRFAPGPEDEPRPRLDHFLAGCDLALTRSQLRRLIDRGEVTVAGAVVTKPGRKLSPGEEVVVTLAPPAPVTAEPQAIALEVLFEDEHIIVINKPAGLVVHPAPGHPDQTLVNALLYHCRDLSGIGGALRPGIVHRLDKDTSGVMVATKSDAAHAALAAAFHEHALTREYVALTAPAPGLSTGTIATLYGRHPVHRKKFSGRVARGKNAVTHWRVEARFGTLGARVRCRLETGRTHQIRVHLSEQGWPVIGDPMYSRRGKHPVVAGLAKELGRQALHAAVLGFAHPITGQALQFEIPLPDDMQRVVDALTLQSAQ